MIDQSPTSLLRGSPCRLLVIATDTAIGKTHVTSTIVLGLRQLGRRVWLHKPVACGDWDGQSSADGRSLRALVADDQEPTSICPLEFSEDCSPHLAARLNGRTFTVADMLAGYDACAAGDHDLVVEGAGGLLAPLTTDDENICTLACQRQLPCVLVTRPHLGTLNHTLLCVEAAQRRGLQLLGLILNHHQPGLGGIAVEHAASELTRLSGLPLLAELPFYSGPPLPLARPNCVDILRRSGARPL